MRFNHFKVFTGNANPALAAEICYELGCQLAAATVKQFADSEVHLQIHENVRGAPFVSCRLALQKAAEWLRCLSASKR